MLRPEYRDIEKKIIDPTFKLNDLVGWKQLHIQTKTASYLHFNQNLRGVEKVRGKSWWGPRA